jgi:hypothetical protein
MTMTIMTTTTTTGEMIEAEEVKNQSGANQW